jgi:hypothetical protein
MSVYRKSAAIEVDAKPTASTLVYEAVDRGSSNNTVVVMFKIFTAPLLVAAALAVFIGGTAGGVGFGATLGYSVWSFRRQRERASLTIEQGILTIKIRGKSTRLRIEEIVDVELDIKKIQRVQEGSSMIPAVRFVESSVAPEVDTARVVIVGESGRVRLSDAYVAHVDAVEWLGKIRVFLRKNGWLPVDEREAEADDT